MLYVGHELLQRELCLAVAAGEEVSADPANAEGDGADPGATPRNEEARSGGASSSNAPPAPDVSAPLRDPYNPDAGEQRNENHEGMRGEILELRISR